MNLEKKYLKYKYKYLLLKQNGGKFLTLERDQQFIDSQFTQILNKGTQNCGVYIQKKNKNKILICNKIKIPEDKLKFIIENLDIYPTLYNEYIINNQYYYLWEKMNGDVRDLFTEIIPNEYLGDDYNFFYLKYNNYPHNIYVINEDMKDLFIKNGYKQIDTNLYEKDYYLCFCKEKDYSTIIKKLKSIENCNYVYIDSKINQIINEIEKNIEIIIKELSKKMLIMINNGFYYSDAKYDNIVYKSNEDGSYKFYFIDPESTLKKITSYDYNNELENINTYIQNKFSFLKLNDMKPNIYENFACKMFNLIEIGTNLPRSEESDKINYLFFEKTKTKLSQVRAAQKHFYPNQNNIFPLHINNKEELEIFLDKK
jgi:hypothetical protein